MDFGNSLAITGAEVGLSLAGLALLLVTAWTGREAARAVTIAAAAALVGALVYTAWATGTGAFDGQTAFGRLYNGDTLSGFARILIYLCAIASLMLAPRWFMAREAFRGEYAVLILFAAVGMGMMVSAGSFITLYIGLELSSLASYVLASFARDDTRSSEAGLKYFILGALASGILLYGMSLVYGFTGSTDFGAVALALQGGLGVGALFGVVFVLAGLAFKIAAVPFHMWTPDVYEGAPTPVTAFFASAPKVAAVAMAMRVVMEPFASQADAWQQIVIFAALASILVGALGAIGQSNLKRLLAYSSINNVGFILIGIAAATAAGASSVLVYLAIYAAMTLGSFAALLMLRDEEGNYLETFDDIARLSTTRPLLASCLLALMFSLAGIPPLLGFWGKFVVFQAAVEANLVPLAAIGIAASVIGAFYYIKFVKVMFFDSAADRVAKDTEWGHWAVLGLAVLFLSPLGYLATPWLGSWADAAAAGLFAAL